MPLAGYEGARLYGWNTGSRMNSIPAKPLGMAQQLQKGDFAQPMPSIVCAYIRQENQ